MFVKSLDLKQFRNYENLSIEFAEGTNILYGSNAQGKTNILEAIYLSGTTKSHRGSKDRDMIEIGKDESHIRMMIDRSGNDYRIDVHLKKNKGKGYAVGGVPLKRAADLFGIASFVFFSPEDLNMIKNGPAGRRRFLDILLCGIDRIYMSDLTAYTRCISQRNALLKEISYDRARISELDVWDIEAVLYGKKIIERRDRFIREFETQVQEKHSSLSSGKESLRLIYEPNVRAELFEEKMYLNRENDLRMKTTGTGPHRDDLAFLANGMDLRLYGSQGQQRTAALSVKMAEIDTIKNEKHEMPVLLLDDVLSELDSERQKALLKSIHSTQTLVTCTGLDEFTLTSFKAEKIFYVCGGKVELRHDQS